MSASPIVTGIETSAVPMVGITERQNVSSPSSNACGMPSARYAIVPTSACNSPAPPMPMNSPRPVSWNASSRRASKAGEIGACASTHR